MPPTHSAPRRPREILRSRTQSLHQATEMQIGWGQIFASRANYLRFLGAMLRINLPAEIAIDRQIGATSPTWFDSRRTSAWLYDDLRQLSEAGFAQPPASDLADFDFVDSPATAAGVVYVLEGSALGGAILAKTLQQKLQITAENGGKYLHGYGKGAGAHWGEVTAWLDATLTDEASIDLAVDAAAKTFSIFGSQLNEFRP
ncbi:MAG: biliverdin-producing heme oxygenase [Blastopirellula sp. JB062]